MQVSQNLNFTTSLKNQKPSIQNASYAERKSLSTSERKYLVFGIQTIAKSSQADDYSISIEMKNGQQEVEVTGKNNQVHKLRLEDLAASVLSAMKINLDKIDNPAHVSSDAKAGVNKAIANLNKQLDHHIQNKTRHPESPVIQLQEQKKLD